MQLNYKTIGNLELQDNLPIQLHDKFANPTTRQFMNLLTAFKMHPPEAKTISNRNYKTISSTQLQDNFKYKTILSTRQFQVQDNFKYKTIIDFIACI